MKKIIIAILTLVLVNAMTGAAFAEESYNLTLQTEKEVTLAVKQLSADGKLSEKDKAIILENASQAAIDAYVKEKVTESFDLAGALNGEVNMDGTSCKTEVFQLENGCTLTMKFTEGADSGKLSTKRAANGETLWKDYGNRYFTATATVDVGLGAGTIALENHYILSEKGVDENYGQTKVSSPSGAAVITAEKVQITDRAARNAGSSDVNMYADFKIISKTGTTGIIEKSKRLSTSVGYVDHNKTTKQIKVKHSWSLS